jgi:hypothetical protein
MDNASNHIKPWSDADIRKYLNGELSPGEMHDLERAALDDPFLADALEGLAGAPTLETDMDGLRSRLAARVEEKARLAPVPWFRRPAFRLAAAVILLVGIGLTAYYSFFDRPSPQLNVDVVKAPAAPVTRQMPAANENSAAVADSAARSDSAFASSYAKADKKPSGRTRLARRPASEPKPVQPTDTALAAAAAAAGYAQTTPPPTAKDSDVADLAKEKAGARAARSEDFLKSFNKSFNAPAASPQRILLAGRVVDINNRPLAGASVFLNNASKIGTTTDAYGNFNFQVRPRDTTQQMTVALAGYRQTLVSLNSNDLANNVIQLQQVKARLNEVVVTGFGAKRKETYATAPSDDGNERPDSTGQKVTPIIGRLAYQQYLDTAKRSLKLDSALFGTERISFQVDQKGQITEFKIEQSLSPAHDAGVIQLISTGPSWRLLRGRKARAVVSVGFP